jgi:hypothetical protein
MAAAVQIGPDSDGYLHLVTDPDDDGTACGLNGWEVSVPAFLTLPSGTGVILLTLRQWRERFANLCPDCHGHVEIQQAEAAYIAQHGHHPADPERRPV